ncbi:MAG: T9SS type A sorting domain-containing protein [Bacteroidetes bacterium]|nr:T9SS type A sorting domain-containing protein [Bacteroidota bacterium]
MPHYLNSIVSRGFTQPPVSQVRTVAEWEEMDAIIISWESFSSVLTEIVRYAKEECKVFIVCSDSNSVKNTLTSSNVSLTNLEFLIEASNSVWIRDYGPNNVYTNEVDSLIIVDWIYNRPRPDDDVIPEAVANKLNVPIYETTQSPYDIIHAGGNFMSDGFGTAFSSNLVLEENPGKTESEIDSVIHKFMGIERYVKMTNLPYDGIHHIDMHMKLIDEETLLVGEYPTGISDGPQIEANLQYVLSNFNSIFGTPYKVIRIPMPPENGNYPNGLWNGADYRTYTNSLIINKTVLVPTYEYQYDTTALRIYKEAMPGYNIVGINCNATIPSSGAIHCISHEIATNDPLLISHQPHLSLIDSSTENYLIEAKIIHRSGIQNASIYYRNDTINPYLSASMSLLNLADNIWSGEITSQNLMDTIYYYIEAQSNSGKTQVRPIVAPAGYWKFTVANNTINIASKDFRNNFNISYSKASKKVFITMNSDKFQKASLSIFDILGKETILSNPKIIHEGLNDLSFSTSKFKQGLYFVVLKTERNAYTEKVIIN